MIMFFIKQFYNFCSIYFYMSLNKIITQIQKTNFQKQVLDYKFTAKFSNYINLQNKNSNSTVQAIEMKNSFLSTKVSSQMDISKHRYHKQILQDQKEEIKIFGYSSSQILENFKKKQNLKNKQKNNEKIKMNKQKRNDSYTQYKLQDSNNGTKHPVRFQRRVYHKLSLNQLQKAANTKNPLPNQLRNQYFTEQLFVFNESKKQNFRIQCNSKNEQDQSRQNGLKSISHFCHQNKNKNKITFQSTNSKFYNTAYGFKKQAITIKKSAQQQLKDKLERIKFNNNFENQIDILRKKSSSQNQVKHHQSQTIQYQREIEDQSQIERRYLQKKQNIYENQNQMSLQNLFKVAFSEDIKSLRKIFYFLEMIPALNQKYVKHVNVNNTRFSIQKELCLEKDQIFSKNYSIIILDIETLDSITLSPVIIQNKNFSFKKKAFLIHDLLNLAFKQKSKNNIFHVFVTLQNTQTLLFQGFFSMKDIHFFSGRQYQLKFFTYYLKMFLTFDPSIKKLSQIEENVSLLLQTELSIPLQFVEFSQSLQKSIVIQSISNKNVLRLSNMLLQSYQTVILIKKQIYQNFNWRGISLKKEETQFKTYNFQHFYI